MQPHGKTRMLLVGRESTILSAVQAQFRGYPGGGGHSLYYRCLIIHTCFQLLAAGISQGRAV